MEEIIIFASKSKHVSNFGDDVATQRIIMCILKREAKKNKVCFTKANVDK